MRKPITDLSQYPVEPGLYWASQSIEGQYDTILRVYGQAPFLKTELIPLPVALEDGSVLVCGSGMVAIGPKVVIPKVKE